MDDRLMPRQPRDAHVEETAEGEAEQNGERNGNPQWNTASQSQNRSLSFA
jgi:hypothetical protein